MAIQTAIATFSASNTPVALSWPALNSNPPAIAIGLQITSGTPGQINVTGLTSTGCTVAPTNAFTGSIGVIASDTSAAPLTAALSVDITKGSIPAAITPAGTGGTIYAQNGAGVLVPTTGAPILEDRGDGLGSRLWTLPALTNLITKPHDFTDGSWSTQGAPARTAAFVLGPDGATPVSRILVTASGADDVVYQLLTGTASACTGSIWLKDDDGLPPQAHGVSRWSLDKYGVNNGRGHSWRRLAWPGEAGSNAFGCYPKGNSYPLPPGLSSKVSDTTRIGGVNVGFAQAVSCGADVPYVDPPSATGARTLTIDPSTVIQSGNLDLTVRGISYFWDPTFAGQSNAVDFYLLSMAGADGAISVRYQNIASGVPSNTMTLAIRGVDVGSIVIGMPDYGEEFTLRITYNSSTGAWRLRFAKNGFVQYTADGSGTTTTGALSARTNFYLGSNAGATVAPIAWTGAFVNVGLSTTFAPEGIHFGDSLSEWFNAVAICYQKPGISYYTALQARTRAGVINQAHHGDQLTDQKTTWDASPYKGASSLKYATILCGVNDLIIGGVTDVTVETRITSLITDIKAANAGIKVIVMQLTPFSAYSGWTAQMTTYAGNVNTWIAGLNGGIDGYVPSAALDSGRFTLRAGLSIDGGHWNQQGQRLVNQLFREKLTAMGLIS